MASSFIVSQTSGGTFAQISGGNMSILGPHVVAVWYTNNQFPGLLVNRTPAPTDETMTPTTRLVRNRTFGMPNTHPKPVLQHQRNDQTPETKQPQNHHQQHHHQHKHSTTSTQLHGLSYQIQPIQNVWLLGPDRENQNARSGGVAWRTG